MVRIRFIGSGALLVLTLVSAASAVTGPLDRPALMRTARDGVRCVQAIRRVDSLLARPQDLPARAWLLGERFVALQSCRAPTAELVAWADSAIAAGRLAGGATAAVCDRAAAELLRRGERLDRARDYAEAGLAQPRPDPDWSGLHDRFLLYRAQCQRAAAAADSAIGTIRQALERTRENDLRRDLLRLEADLGADAGRPDDALRAHLQLAGDALRPDTSRAADLRRIWSERHGSLAGLEEALAAERNASRRWRTFEQPRVDRALPDLAYPSLEGPAWRSKSLRGRVAVVDFWGTWCRFCVEGLPTLQRLYERFGPQGVAFVAVDAEAKYGDLASQRKAVARFLKERRITIPNVLAVRGAGTDTLAVSEWPTTWIVDRRGRIRFENRGFFPGTDEIIAAQLDSLLKTR